jgi:hypothetical protein
VSLQGAFVLHDPALLNRHMSGAGDGLPEFPSDQYNDFFRHASHQPDPTKPIYGKGCRMSSTVFRFPNKVQTGSGEGKGGGECRRKEVGRRGAD